MGQIKLSKTKLRSILPWLEQQFPNSLPVYHIACNILENRFSYPKMEFIVDKMQTPSVCVCKPVRSKTTRDYIPEFNDHLLIFIHSNQSEQCRVFWAMQWNVPELFNWGKDMTFIDVDPTVAQILLSVEDRDFKHIPPAEGCPTGERVFNFNLSRCEIHRYPMRDDLKLGILTAEDAEQIVQECHYANPSWIKVFQYMLSHEFPSVTLYDDKDKPISPRTACTCCTAASGLGVKRGIGTCQWHCQWHGER
ncbi:uncharacterized protein LOC129601990 [Paramacrobiotus metropolitanus]|uniref:uncharacterized protein LOC129601990 n=1 Tax=Paramacrobiotus metropolitanus TaxID=2943436 RepID=UPI0024460C76|nr:uncharacterized protein LOC129601990 [Paramacrobiotus metropolitanus]